MIFEMFLRLLSSVWFVLAMFSIEEDVDLAIFYMLGAILMMIAEKKECDKFCN